MKFAYRYDFFKSAEQGRYEDSYGNTAFHVCAWYDDIDLARRLTDVNKNKPNNNYRPIHFVIQRNGFNTKKLLTLLDPSRSDLISLDPQGRTCLESAAYHGNDQALEWILKFLKDHDKKTKPPAWKNMLKKLLDLACEQGHDNVAKILCDELLAKDDLLFSELANYSYLAAISGAASRILQPLIDF